MRRSLFLLLALGGTLTLPALAAQPAAPTWPSVFGDAHPPVHLSASYPDAQGKMQPLEFWRDTQGRVVRRTGNRAELWLTPAPDGEDQYQLRNLVSRAAFDVHRVNLYRVGIFTDRWSVQHLLDRPAGAYTLARLDGNRAEHTPAGPCEWWRLTLASGQVTDICWSARFGLPLALRSGGRTLMSVSRVQPLAAFPAARLSAEWQEYNADEDLAPD